MHQDAFFALTAAILPGIRVPTLVQVLVLYRERSGERGSGSAGIMSAGAFSIQRLEGSRFGTSVLWVLYRGAHGEGEGTKRNE